MSQIRISSLPAASPASSTDVVAIDGATTRKATLTEAVNAGRPFASQAEAEAGTVATKGMSPLLTAQAIAALGGAAFSPLASKVPTGGTVNQVLGKTGAGDYAMSWRNAGAGDLIAAANLSDVADAATALGNLGGQPLDTDLTAIAALTTATYGRSLLTLANSTALSGELSAFYQPLDADLTSWAGVTRAAGFDTFASGPTSANLKALVSDETGSGALVFATSPTFVTPALGTPASGVATNLTFTQAGTGAVSRTIPNKFTETVSVKDFGAAGDGVTDDTAAIQAAETYRASVGGELVFPPGTYQISATSITANRANGGAWRGLGEAILRASANATFLCILTGAVAGTTNKPFLISGLHFHGGGFTTCRGVHETSPYGTTIDNCTFTQMSFCASFIGPNSATQMGWIQISNIRQYGGGSWAFYGFDNTKYLFHIEMNNIHQVGTGSSANWENDFWIEGRRAVGLSINNCWSGSLDGGAAGLRLRGDCQGVFVTNATFVWPTIGLDFQTWTDSLKPSYVYMTNIGIDQHTASGAEIEARTMFLTNANFANGYVHTNTGQGCLLKSTCTDISFENVLFAYDQKSGLVVQNGAAKVRVANYTAENNNQVAGAFYEVDLGASPFTDVRLHGRNVIGAAGVNATGQRLINGVTSPAVSLNNTPASTAANTTATDLMTYSIPASALKIGQRVRFKAWGTTAANANTKTGRLFFGSANLGGWSSTLNAVSWEINAEVNITGSNTQSYNRNTLGTSAITQNLSGTATEVMTSAIVVKFQGQNGVATASDITCNGLVVEIID